MPTAKTNAPKMKELNSADELMTFIASIPTTQGVDEAKVEELVRAGKSLAEAREASKGSGEGLNPNNMRSNVGSRMVTLIKAGKVRLVDVEQNAKQEAKPKA